MKLKYSYKFIVPCAALLIGLTSCTDFLTESNENSRLTPEVEWSSPKSAEGVLLAVYNNLPSDYTAKDDWATDDMVTNVLTDATVLMGTGGWTSTQNPLSNYSDMYKNFTQLNDFLAHVDNVKWTLQTDTKGDTLNAMYVKRLKGEGYGLRAYCGSQLLKMVGGIDASGNLLGYPIVTTVVKTIPNGQLPRNTYSECVKQIFADCDSAYTNLPLIYADADLSANQKRVLGVQFANRINGKTVKLIKSNVALIAASPAFLGNNSDSKVRESLWTEAAKYAADVMILNNGLYKLNKIDPQFYLQVDLTYLNSYTECFWYTSNSKTSSTRESNNFPPTLLGKGQINPSQNLVDCFPDKNGFPITSPKTKTVYNAATPYLNRDPRLTMYIYYDGAKTTGTVTTIRTAKGTTLDAKDSTKTSTRTSYYMRKLMNEGTLSALATAKLTSVAHTYVYARYTTALLNFAEAANEVGGPDLAIGGFTARQVIDAIRSRADIVSKAYTASLTTQGDFRTLIHNERRIELCFEGYRFWDLRRWVNGVTDAVGLSKLNEPVAGVSIDNTGTIFTPVPNLEVRSFQPYMIYAPIPYSETLKYNIIQNQGW
ncbi:MAG: RagB/SusD family nutrient uptake outer membrane protein [Paludibacter sp.]